MNQRNSQLIKEEHLAKASAQSLPLSTKHCIEVCRYLKYKNTLQAKKILTEVIALKKVVPFKRFKHNIGHKPGLAAGRFPQKAARQILRLIKSAEANAQFKGLNTSCLKITKLLANRAAIPLTGRRHRTSTKRTNLEIEVREAKEKKETKEKPGAQSRESRAKEPKPKVIDLKHDS